MAAANGLSRRRQRSSSLRESHVVEEDVQIELQDTLRLRDRANKRERERERERNRDRYRDREFSKHCKNQNKHRKGDSVTVGEEESTEESVADEEDFKIEERRVAHTTSCNTNQSSRKKLPPSKFVKQAPALEAAEELIGASIPRKARSASVKRSHESWLSGNGGFWEDRKASSTSTVSRSVEANSPSSSYVSVRKKMRPNGSKTRLQKVVKCSTSSSVQHEDIEIEIAEVLFGLMEQYQNSKEEGDGDNIQKLESKDAQAISQDKSLVSVMPQNTSPASDLLPDAPKKKKLEVDNSSNPVLNGSVSSSIKIESKMETSASNSEQPASREVDAPKVASMIVEPREEVTKQGDLKLSNEGSGSADGPVTEKQLVSAKEEFSTCLKMDVDFQDSTVTKATSIVLGNESQEEEKFKIDLMAPPSMVSAPETDSFNDFASDPSFQTNDVKMKTLVKDEEKTERFLKKEPAVEEIEEKKIEAIGEKRRLKIDLDKPNEKRQLKIDLDKPNQDNGKDNSVKLQRHSQKQQQQQLQTKSTIAKVKKTESSSVSLKISVAGWPNGLQPLGDGSTRSSTAQQTTPFMLSQPRPKRCATHCYIARNIYLNQQLAKMNLFWPSGAGSALSHGDKPNNHNAMPSTENIIHGGNTLQGSFPLLNLNAGQDKGHAVASFPHPAQEDKSSEGVNFMDPELKKQLVLQRAPQPAPAGNILHAPALIFPVSQQQQAVVTAGANQPGPSNSAATSTKSTSVSGNSTAVLPASSTALQAAVAAVSYNFPNLAGYETPYLTIQQNNGYPFPVATPIGSAPAIRGGTNAQALPFFNGSFYSPQIFHPSQLQHQQQPHPQPLMQAAHQNTSASSSSHKQLYSKQPKGVPVSGNNFVSSISMQSQQTQKQHVSSSNQNRKLEAETDGENILSVADSRLSHSQTSVYGQNSVPLQPLNFSSMPSLAVGGGSTVGSEKQQQSQQKSLKGGVEIIPQSFAMPFASFCGGNSPLNLNFSSLQHNPAIVQSFTDMARLGYKVVPASQAAPQKNNQISEVKTGGGSSNHNEGKKPGLGKSSSTNAQTLFSDDSARTRNFVSSPVTETNVPFAANSQNFQQQHLLQLQKQQMLQQATATAARSKVQTASCMPSSSIAAKLSNKAPVFSQTIVQSNNSSQSPQWKNSARNPTNQVPPASINSSSTSSIKNVSQQEDRSPQGHTNISFERHSKSGLAPQGQQNTHQQSITT